MLHLMSIIAENRLSLSPSPSLGQLICAGRHLVQGTTVHGFARHLELLPTGGDLPGAEGPDPQLRKGYRGLGEEVTLTYTVPMPSDGAVSESAPVLDFVQSGPPLHGEETVV